MSSIGILCNAAVIAGVVSGVIALVAGLVVGAFVYKILLNKKIGNSKSNAVKIIEEAYAEAKSIKKESVLEAKEEAQKIKDEANSEARERRGELQKQEERLDQREEYLTKKETLLDAKAGQLENDKTQLENEKTKITEQLKEQNEIREQMLEKLEKLSGLSKKEAKDILIESVTEEAKKDAGILIKQIEDDAKERADKIATDIVVGAIQKCATDLSSEMTITTVALPNDEMKGRIIGREGRNIRSIEAATGVELIVDDTPEAITVSSFDPIRREIARLSLEKLIVDGRIHPARIEEIVEKATRDVDKIIKEAGESACNDVGIYNLNPELVKIMGRLKYRTSYGQNCLKHSIETSIIAGLLATELGANVQVAKRGGFLHDIGKALDHEIEGTHVAIGIDLAKKYKESEAVIHCIHAHHGEVPFNSVEAIIVQVADAISSSRPGARRENLENYIKRLEQLETICNGFKGVEKSYAIQAGREVRIIVKPDQINDSDAVFLVKDIAKKIEQEMQYPGQIKVVVIRENRFTDTAK
ncbi:MAG: ribonuclease Y [Clostridia bacterium]|nr:ribonuclease Y [Clostridia bacterium]